MSALPASEPTLHRFRLSAAADPGMLARLLEPFAKRSVVPERLRSERRDDMILVEILSDMPPETAALIAGALGATVGVTLLAAD